ncbi:hypothetical protein [Acetobacter sp.]|uniref:hypothetical protein n=1 Tax=Acetobacter sp. TaxID=440 RepID=UPI0039E9A5CE
MTQKTKLEIIGPYTPEHEAGYELAMRHIEEAERRAEQRVRAEIARDSERLDWLSDGQHQLAVCDGIGVVVTDDSGETHIHDDIRQAIDAAREVG